MSESLFNISLKNGEQISYRKVGNGKKNLVLVHGNMSASGSWDLLIEQLPKEEFTIYALDLRGFGQSTYHKPVSSLQDFSEDLKMFVDELSLDVFSIAGWSTGGGVAMEFAAEYPEKVEKLILISSVGIKGYTLYKKNILGMTKKNQIVKTREEIEKEVSPLLKAKAKKNTWLLRLILNKSMFTINKPEKERLDNYVQDMLAQRNLVDVNYALITFNITDEPNFVVDGSGKINKVKTPTLIFHGEDDKVVNFEESKKTAEALGDKAQLILFPNCGHSPLVDKLEELTNSMVDFIKA